MNLIIVLKYNIKIKYCKEIKNIKAAILLDHKYIVGCELSLNKNKISVLYISAVLLVIVIRGEIKCRKISIVITE